MTFSGPMADGIGPHVDDLQPDPSISMSRDGEFDWRFSSGEGGFPFSQSQLSLALSIQKLKPAGVSTRDFCLQIQQHIKLETADSQEQRRYIDTTEFWKEQYSKLHLEKVALEGRVAVLEAAINHHEIHHKIIPDAVVDKTTANTQRRDISATDRQCTNDFNPRQSGLFSPGVNLSESKHLKDQYRDQSQQLLDLPLLKQSVVLHQLLQDLKVPTGVLISSIQSSLWHMSHYIRRTSDISGLESTAQIGRTRFQLCNAFDTVTAVFDLCLKGLRHLCRDIPGRRCKGQVIYLIVKFFQTCVRDLHKFCLHGNLGYFPSAIDHQRQHEPGDNLTSSRRLLNSCLISEYTKFLAKTLTCTEMQNVHTSQLEVLEGLFSVLLEELGGILSRTVFGDHLPSSSRPGRIGDGTKSSMLSNDNTRDDLAGYQLTYVLEQVLEKVMKRCLEKGEASIAPLIAGADFSGGNLHNVPLLDRARRRLQETLLRGVFGEEGEQFANALMMPKLGEGWEHECLPAAEDRNETFFAKVWTTVGWDLIFRH